MTDSTHEPPSSGRGPIHVTGVTRREFVQLSAFGLGGLALSVACGPSATSTASATRQAALATLKIGYASEPQTLDPQLAPGVNEVSVLTNIMEGLVMLDKDNKPTPRLAESYSQIDDKTWQFNLRKNVTFQNGETFDAQSVNATYARSKSTTIPIKNTYADDINLDRIEIVDDYTVRFHLTDPTPFILARMSNDQLLFPPKWLASSDAGTVAHQPVGTGRYSFKEWVSGSSLTLVANAQYWGSPKAAIGTVVYQFIPDVTSRVDNLKTGAVQIINSIDPASVPLISRQSGLTVESVQVGRRVYAGFNTKLKPMDDVRVRQAINYGTDVETICKTLLAGTTTRMHTYAEAPYQDPTVKGYTYDPEKAKSLLQAAGLGGGFTLTFDVDNGSYLGGRQFPEAVAASLLEIGIKVTINRIDRSVATQQQRARQTHEMYLRSNASYYDPDLTFSVWGLKAAGNGTQWDDAAFQSLLKQSLTGGTAAQRLDWSNQLQARLMDQAPALFLWIEPAIYGVDSSKVHGFKAWLDEHLHLDDLN